MNANDRECIRPGHEIGRLVAKRQAADDPAPTMWDAERDDLITRWIEAIEELARVPRPRHPPQPAVLPAVAQSPATPVKQAPPSNGQMRDLLHPFTQASAVASLCYYDGKTDSVGAVLNNKVCTADQLDNPADPASWRSS